MKMNGYAERRREFRAQSNERLFVQITACETPELIGTTISCRVLDVSAEGMRISSDAVIPRGCKLDIWIDNAAQPGKYFLTSDVRWSEIGSDGKCYLGIQLQEGATTDIEDWRRAHG